jgi:hypothetical protein
VSAVSDADREKAIDLTAPWFSGSSRGLAATAIDVLIEAGWRPLVSATLDPKPWRDIYTGARFERQNMLTLGYEFSPGPEYVQDRAAYEPAPATPEQEAQREQIAGAVDGCLDDADAELVGQITDAVLAVLPSREPVAPTEEQIARVLHPGEFWDEPGTEYVRSHVMSDPNIRAVLALLPGESREAVEAAQRERDARRFDVLAAEQREQALRYIPGEVHSRCIARAEEFESYAAAIREAGRREVESER